MILLPDPTAVEPHLPVLTLQSLPGQGQTTQMDLGFP